jgi:hypothetical protein
MAKLIGTIRITPNPASDKITAHFEVSFVPYSARLSTKAVLIANHDDLVEFLIRIKLSEDEASRWAGRARSEGVILIPGIERSEALLKENGLLS